MKTIQKILFLHMYAENEPAMKRNESVLNELPGKLYTIEANGKIPGNFKCPLELIQESKESKANKNRRFNKVAEAKSWRKSNINS